MPLTSTINDCYARSAPPVPRGMAHREALTQQAARAQMAEAPINDCGPVPSSLLEQVGTRQYGINDRLINAADWVEDFVNRLYGPRPTSSWMPGSRRWRRSVSWRPRPMQAFDVTRLSRAEKIEYLALHEERMRRLGQRGFFALYPETDQVWRGPEVSGDALAPGGSHHRDPALGAIDKGYGNEAEAERHSARMAGRLIVHDRTALDVPFSDDVDPAHRERAA